MKKSTLALSALLALAPALRASTLLDDNFSRLSHWRFFPQGSAARVATHGLGGATLTIPADVAPYQLATLAYIGPGLRPGGTDVHTAFFWSTYHGPVTYSFSIDQPPALSGETGLGYEFLLVLSLGETVSYPRPQIQPAHALLLRVAEVGAREEFNGGSHLVAELFFKSAKPNGQVSYHQDADKVIALTNREDRALKSLQGTWSFTIHGDQVYLTNPRGTRSATATLPAERVALITNPRATLHMVVGNNTRTDGATMRIGHVSVLPGMR